MKTSFLKSILFAAITAGFLTSCVNDDDYSVPTLACTETNLVKNMEPNQVPKPAVAAKYNGAIGDVIEAYVVSSDLGGNFFKAISLQTLDGSFGFSVPVDVTSVFSKFEPGRKVFIQLKSNTDTVYTDLKFGSLRIGTLFEGQVGRLSLSQYNNILKRSCTVVNENQLVKNRTIADTKIDSRINTLIELQNVRFEESAHGKKYYDAGNQIGGATNYNLIDDAGNTIIFRTSSFANYAGSKVPNGTGTVRGVLTKFNSDYQFVARYEEDIKISNTPSTDPENPGEEPSNPSATATGGTAISYTGSFTENFESYTVGANAFPKYINDYTLGNRYWAIKNFSSNNYIEMSSFNGAGIPGKPAETFFFVPVNFDAASTFSFDKEIRYMKGEALKVYYVTAENYTAGNTINVGNFVDITSNFTNLVYPAMDASQSSFTTAGTYNIPANVTGNGFFVFEYIGSSTVTTTIQIDNITVN